MKRINTHETELTPFSKLVFTGLTFTLFAISPKTVPLPVTITVPVALPLITLEPINARFGVSVKEPKSEIIFTALGFFSTDMLSPVSADWLMNKSLA